MEREQGKEKIHPNQIINNALNYYILQAIEQGLLKQKGETRAMLGIIEHLTQSGAFEKGEAFPKKEVFEAEKNQVLELAKSKSDPQALLFYSYLPFLENLKDVVTGKIVIERIFKIEEFGIIGPEIPLWLQTLHEIAQD